jgi:hypothetical protein
MTQLNLTGGARIGMANATWPFASLKVDKDRLDLNATIVGNLIFKPDDIISIEPYYMIPIIGQGIKINHRIPKYKNKVIFWTFKNPNEVINQIRQTGFLDNTSNPDSLPDNKIIEERQKQGGFPIKIPFAIAVVVIWNILFLLDFLDFFNGNTEGMPLGDGVKMALGFVLITSILTLISSGFRKIVLKEGRELKDISKFLYFIIFICAFMLINLTVFMKL